MTFSGFFKRLDDFLKTTDGLVILCFTLFATTGGIFWPALHGSFLTHDDYAYVVNNTHVNSGLTWGNIVWAFTSVQQDNWHPLTWISHALDVEIYDQEVWGHHLTSVLLHAASTVLVFLVFRKMTGASWRSLIAASLFGLHPLRVESVAWISERKDVLSVFFGLLALWTYARFAEEAKSQNGRTRHFYGLTLLFFVCSLMSKSMLVTLPFLFLLLDYWPLKRWQEKPKRNLIVEKVPFLLLTVAVGVIAYVAQKRGGATEEMAGLPMTDRFENALVSYVRYLGKLFWPENLCCYYPHPVHLPMVSFLSAGVFVICLSGLGWMKRRQFPYFFVGWFWFIGTLAPVIGLVQLGSAALADRYSYVPSIGICLLVVWGFCDLTSRWQTAKVRSSLFSIATLAVYAMLTRQQIGYWKDDITMWSRAVAVTKDNYVAHDSLGNALHKTNPSQAFAEFQSAIDINSNYGAAQRDLAVDLAMAGKFEDAINHLNQAILAEPKSASAYHGLGFCLWQSGRAADAIQPLLKAAELDSSNPSYVGDLTQVIFEGGQPEQSVSNFLWAAQDDPKGFDNFLHATEINPSRPDYLNELAWAFATHPDSKLRNGQFAIRLATRACEITGYHVTVCVGTLAAANAEAGRFDDAITTAQKACDLADQHGETDLFQRNRQLLEIYRSHQPYHEVPKPTGQ